MTRGAAETTVRQLAPEERLRRLELMVTRRLDGMLQGQYLGLLPGPGSEFAGSREYRPGEDEVRWMDWAVTARTNVPHVREVDADRELTTWVLVDGSASMDFGTAEVEKRELAVAAVAAVGFLTAGAGNRLGAHLVGGTRRAFPARTGRTHLRGVLKALLDAPRVAPGAQSDIAPTVVSSFALAPAIAGVARAARRRGLVVVVSDFLDDSDWAGQLRRLAARHQVLAVEVADPREFELPDVGLITLIDTETGRRREVSTASRRLRGDYAAAAAAERVAVRAAIRGAGAVHLPLRTDRDFVADIVRHVLLQRRLAAAAPRPGGGT